MLRVIYTSYATPWFWPIDPSATFQAGQIAQLTAVGNNIVCGVSDGSAPIGIIDDNKTASFFAAAWDEEVITPIIPTVLDSNNQKVSQYETKVELINPNVDPDSFVSLYVDCALSPRNGVVTFPAGTPVNFDLNGSGEFNAIRTVVRYTYTIPNTPGDDTTAGSGRMTVWIGRIIAETDQYETGYEYPLNANLYVSEFGKLTSRQPTNTSPAIGIVTGPPSAMLSNLEFLYW